MEKEEEKLISKVKLERRDGERRKSLYTVGIRHEWQAHLSAHSIFLSHFRRPLAPSHPTCLFLFCFYNVSIFISVSPPNTMIASRLCFDFLIFKGKPQNLREYDETPETFKKRKGLIVENTFVTSHVDELISDTTSSQSRFDHIRWRTDKRINLYVCIPFHQLKIKIISF